MPFIKPEPEYKGKPLSQWVAETQDEDSQVRLAAAWALSQIGPKAKTAVPALTQLLKGKDVWVRVAAAKALGKIGSAAIPPLMELLRGNDEWVGMTAASVLGKIGPAATSTLTKLLKDKDSMVRMFAASALGKIGPAGIPPSRNCLGTRKGWFGTPLLRRSVPRRRPPSRPSRNYSTTRM